MYNYSKNFLDKIAIETGFIRDNLEKVFRLYDILQFLNSNIITSDFLSLKGGTAINLTIFKMPRLSVDVGDREVTLEAGCNDYITKPIKKDQLLGLLQKYLV